MPERRLAGEGRVRVPAPPLAVLDVLLRPDALACLVPGAEAVEQPEPGLYSATLRIGVGRLAGCYRAELRLHLLDPSRALRVSGSSAGLFGHGTAAGQVSLRALPSGGTLVSWRYEGTVGGPVTLAGSLPLRVATRVFIGRFFAALAAWPFAEEGPGALPRQAARFVGR